MPVLQMNTGEHSDRKLKYLLPLPTLVTGRHSYRLLGIHEHLDIKSKEVLSSLM